jgi:hypothetical protein
MERYLKIIETLKANGISTQEAFIATSCDTAFGELDDNTISFDNFCSVCYDMWLDCNEDTGLTTIADKVAYYTNDNGHLPESFTELLDY